MGNSNASSSGTLPSNTITNPRCEARAITTRSGLSYTPVPPIPPPLYDENEPLTEKETEVTKDKVLPSTKDIQPPVIQKSHDPVKPVGSPISPEPSSPQVDNSPPSKEPSKKTKLPYPSRVEHEKKGENDKVQIQKFWEMFKKIHVDITLADALILMPKYQKMLKSLLSNKEKLNEMANTPVSETCSAIILKKLPEKLGDPGQFLIPCNFSELKCKALADLGASINLMPFSVYTKLGLPALQSTRMTLELANCSLCVPKGIARDVLVPVGKFTFPADFVVVDFECNYQVPLILGRPFLRTARVLIDVHGEELVIRDGLERIVFKPDGSQDNESIHMMDVYDDRFKDVCEPESNDDSTTSAIVDEFESLLGDIIKQKEELKGISDPVARRRACFARLDKCKIISQGKVIHSPKKASIIQSKGEVHTETFKSYLNPLFEKDEEIISNEASSIISPKVDVKTIVSFFAPIGNFARKWASSEVEKDNVEVNHEVFKSNSENSLGIHDDKEEEIAFLDGLLRENFFDNE
ncbi:reverse transcriptase domain-containing protein [Tanacetum coccineum]|uniref:Reverse transcriptase domain-containing protein n=1 Tax=Tanacetum coccineum TaxID=301880 RepID=A0ABQ5DV42_9ASTR